MNLRVKKSLIRQRGNKKNEHGLIIYIGIYSFILVCLFSSVLGATLYFNGQSEKMNREISVNDSESYKLQREIQNIKVKLENLSRKEYIVFKINQYRLGLHAPEPFQVININSTNNNCYNQNNAKQVAYSSVY